MAGARLVIAHIDTDSVYDHESAMRLLTQAGFALCLETDEAGRTALMAKKQVGTDESPRYLVATFWSTAEVPGYRCRHIDSLLSKAARS